MDDAQINRELDKAKARTFLGRNAAFFGPILSQLQFVWSTEIQTAGTDGKTFFWNREDFLRLAMADRVATIEHELQHVARLHMIRCGSRCPKVWNIGCDIIINRSLRAEGHVLEEKWWIGETPECPETNEEDVYDWLNKPNGPGQQLVQSNAGSAAQDHQIIAPGGGTQAEQAATLNMVVNALTQAKMAGKMEGTIAGDIDIIVSEFLAPVVKWEALLQRFFSDMLDEDYSWRRPSRRHDPMRLYLPSRFTDDGRLEHLAYYLDVSGSISQEDIVRFNSEVKYIKDHFNPEKLTLVTFDTRITSEEVIMENDRFDKLEVVGGGGTCLRPVRQHIIDNRPTAAIIFSDLRVTPMQALPPGHDIPIIWICVENPTAKVPFGELLHIKS